MTYVDERIVELRFDNKQFEQETAKSMNTLDKLKEKLQFKNASSGAEQLQKAVANINVNPVINGIGAIETKMSALGIAGKRVIENLTDWAMSGINKIVHKLEGPVNQIITGGKSRALNIEQAKFQLEGLGVAWSEIQEDINYGVQDTAYGLDAAAKVASQLVASNVQLGDDMKHALLGISGVAAMTNSTYEDIGRVYTSVAGNGRLMGEQLLQLSSRGINAAATLAKALNTTESEVRDMVSKGQVSFQMFSDAMFEAFGEHAKSANKTFQGALSNTKAALSRLGADVAAQGFNSIRDILNDIIPKLKEFKKKIKPVEDSIIKMVDAVGKLVQAFIKAIDIKKIVDKLTPILKGAADAITDFALAYEYVFNRRKYGSNDAAFFAEQRGLKELKTRVVDVSSAMENLYEINDKQKEMANDIWKLGRYGNGQDRIKALGKDYNIVQAYIEKMIEFGWDEAKMNEYLAEQEKAHKEAVEDTQRALKKRALVENLMDIFGNLKHVVKNIAESIGNIIKVALSSFSDAFKGKSLTESLVIFTAKLAELSDRFKITEKRAEKLRPAFDGLFKILKSIGSVIKTAVKWTGKLIDGLIEIFKKLKLGEIMQKIVDGIRKAFNKLKDVIVIIYEKLKELGLWDLFIDILSKLGDALKTAVKWVGKFIEGLVEILKNIHIGEILQKVVDGIRIAFGKLKDVVVEVYEKLKALGIWDKFLDMLSSLKDVVIDIYEKIKDLGLLGALKDFLGGLVEIFKSFDMSKAIKATFVIGLIASTLLGLKGLYELVVIGKKTGKILGGVKDFLKSLTSLVNIYGKKAKAEIFDMFASAVLKITAAIIALMAAIAILEYIGFDSKKILSMATITVLGVLALYGVIQILVAALSKSTYLDKSITFAALKLPLMIFGIAALLSALVNAVKFFYNIFNDKDLNVQNFAITMGVIVGFVALVFLLIEALSRSADNSVSMTGLMGVIFGVSLMMYTLVKALKKIYKMAESDEDAAAQAFVFMGILMFEVFAFLAALRLLAGKYGSKGTSAIKGLASLMLGIAVLLRIGILPLMEAVIDVYDSGDKAKNRRKGLRKFEDMAQALLLFVSVVAGVTLALSKNAESSPIFAMAATIAAMALLFASLAIVIKSAKGIDAKTLDHLSIMIAGLVTIVGLLMVVMTVASAASADTATAALWAMAAAFAAVGVMLLGAGAGFYIFQKALKEMISNLPGMIDDLLVFFKKVHDNYDDIVNGISETITLMGDGFLAALKALFDNAAKFVPALIGSMLNVLVITIDGLAIALDKNGGELADAAYNLAVALVKFLGKVFDIWKELAGPICESTSAWLIHKLGKAILKGFRNLLDGIDDWFVGMGALGSPIGSYIRDANRGLIDGVDEAIEAWDNSYDFVKDAIPDFAWDKPRGDMYDDAYAAAEEYSAWANEALENGTDVRSWFDIAYDKITGEKDEDFVGGITSWVKGRLGGLSDSLAKELEGSFKNVNLSKVISLDELRGFSSQDFANEFGIHLSDESFNGFINGIDKNWTADSPELEAYMNDFFTDLNVYDGDWLSTGTLWGDNLGDGILESKDHNVQIAKEVQDAIIDRLYKAEPEFYLAGKYCSAGYGNGFNDPTQILQNGGKVNQMVLAMRNALAETAQIQSPSKMFAELGKYCSAGLALGMTQGKSDVEDASSDIATVAMNSLKEILNRIFNTTIEGMDMNPKITPVLDLSLLQQGLGQMGAMMGGSTTYGLALGAGMGYNSNLAARNAALGGSDIYDGTNVVEAINGLRGDMNAMKDAMANMGFYVDSREMAKVMAKPMNSELNDIYIREGRGVK